MIFTILTSSHPQMLGRTSDLHLGSMQALLKWPFFVQICPQAAIKRSRCRLTLTNHIPSVLYMLPNACEQSCWPYICYRSTALLKTLSSLTALALPKSKEFESKGNSNHTETGGHQSRAKQSRSTFTLPNKPQDLRHLVKTCYLITLAYPWGDRGVV